MTDSIQLVIKAPNQKVSDQTIDCELSWTVLQLKTHLSIAYPTKPKIEDQKLIYSGHMLLDNLTLKDVLRNDTGQKHTLHLVCASSNVTQSPTRNSQNTENDTSFNSNPTSQQGTPGTSLHYRGIRQNGENFTNVSHNGIPQFPVTGGQPLNPELMAQQMAAMQQFYAQYMAQIMQNAQLAGIGTYPNIAFSPVFTPATGVPINQGFAPTPVENPNVPRANANAAAPAANANVRMNAQGGAVLEEDEEDMENRDWLDWFYIVCRAVVLFSVVYFYSSLGRFMVVFGLAILIYMYQAGWFGQRPGVQPNPEANQPAAQNQNENVQPQNDEPPQENDDAMSSPNIQDNAENEVQIQEELREIEQLMDGDIEPHHTARPEQSPMKVFWTFFTSFFTSMIPEQPAPPINVN